MSKNQYTNAELGNIPTLAKKFIFPKPILISPKASGTKHKLKIGRTEFILHVPRLKTSNGNFIFYAPSICKRSGIPAKTWDKLGGDSRSAWGKVVESSRGNNEIPSLYLKSVMITTTKLSKRARLPDKRLKDIHDRLIHWYTIFAKWVELTTYQDLDYLLDSNVAGSFGVSTGSWVNKTNDGTLVQHASIKLNRDKPYKSVQLDVKMLRSFICKANCREEVSLADSMLVDARRKLYRQDYHGCCLHFCQYIEASFRNQIQIYLKKQGMNDDIASRFLERRLLPDLIVDSRKFKLPTHMTNRESDKLVFLRNKLVHVRYNANTKDVVLPRRVSDSIFDSRQVIY